MYPRQHAVVSGTVTFLYAVFIGVSSADLVVWTVIGVLSGVFIDVDHVLLSMLVANRIDKGAKWFRHPVKAVTDPDALLADMEYDALVYHRMVSHVLVLIVIMVLTEVHILFLPAAAGLAAHIFADILWDLKQGSYGL